MLRWHTGGHTFNCIVGEGRFNAGQVSLCAALCVPLIPSLWIAQRRFFPRAPFGLYWRATLAPRSSGLRRERQSERVAVVDTPSDSRILLFHVWGLVYIQLRHSGASSVLRRIVWTTLAAARVPWTSLVARLSLCETRLANLPEAVVPDDSPTFCGLISVRPCRVMSAVQSVGSNKMALISNEQGEFSRKTIRLCEITLILVASAFW